jgi:hypothetical protein
MNNQTHIANFVAGINNAIAQCERIMQHLDDHCGVAPDDVNGNHVGTVWHVVAQLNDIQTFLGIKEE